MALPGGTLWRRLIPPIDKRSAKSFIRTNEKIRAREVRVIDENGEQLGVMAPFEALKMARERSLDLVEISPNAVPPVCKIQDYGKYLYEKDKSDRAARKKQKVIVIKEVKFSVTVDEHDYQTKKNMAVRFLGEGDKVKASLRFKGRQMAHRDLGYKIINRLILDIGDAGTVEFMPRMEGTTLHAILAPIKKAEVQQPPARRKQHRSLLPAHPPTPPEAAPTRHPAPDSLNRLKQRRPANMAGLCRHCRQTYSRLPASSSPSSLMCFALAILFLARDLDSILAQLDAELLDRFAVQFACVQAASSACPDRAQPSSRLRDRAWTGSLPSLRCSS